MNRIICIDPGHGKPWPGAVFGFIKESEFVLNIAAHLAGELQKRGYFVVKTRYSNFALVSEREKLVEDLNTRAQIANMFKANIFISLHFNAHENHAANGVESWYFQGSVKGRHLAECIQNQLIKKFKMRNRGIKGTNKLIVLRKTLMPAVLIELGFISNPKDREIMASSDYPQNAACAIADGVDSYFQ
ncbi:hypothetical protein BBF96_13670 [Anoxybacter fermentans]|uniref:MurNAc-LAA domain-containing protein n=1 Tax=Anoxybacter fermentans TaxID=1323375 RepID=A0A3S9T1A9_9FIRM|nr:N-acetylmuramoyl-L-alanine amidase [Anoxybacter fermentans]AZR74344.1 hypothetical protein BBF96_13670 [Anoxybacter fermentans]